MMELYYLMADKNDGQNIPNVKAAGGSFPTDIRPIALRGPLVIQGWGYDLNGKPIPNKEDDESDARGGTFKSDELKDEFLDDWIQKRETWPVAPVDLRYDRDRKVWTIPNTFRIIQVSGSGEIAPGASAECDPLNINTVYNSAGTEVAQPKVTVTNPSWNTAVASGQSFYAFYDTKDCTYYPVALSGACAPQVTGSGDITVTVSESGGCKTYTVSGCDPIITGTGAGNSVSVTVSETDGCKTYNISGSGGCETRLYGSGTTFVIPTGECSYIVSGSPHPIPCLPKVSGTGSITVTVSGDECKTYTVSGCDPVVTGTGGITVATSETDGCKTYTISGCQTAITGLGGIIVAESGDCGYTISSCQTAITGLGGITIAESGDCGYTISGCQTAITGLGGITIAESGDCGYTISGCEVTITGAGGITTTKEGDCEYTISGCEVTVTGGSGIVVEKEGCEYTVNAEVTCNTKVDGAGCIIVSDNGADPECPEYLIEIDPACINDFNNPHWSLCGSAVTSGADITFTTSTGCGAVTCGSDAVNIEFPKQAVIAGLGSITVAESGDCTSDNFGYTISGCTTHVEGGGSIYVTQSGLGNCKVYTISGSASGASGSGTAEYIDTDYCGWAATQTTCTEIPCLTLGSGLQLYEGTKLRSPLLEVEGTYAGCGSSAEGVSAARRITFGDNTIATKDSECLWTVKGLNQKIVGTEGVCGQDNLGSTDFQKLTFGKNLGVKKDDAGDCDYTISGLDQKIVGTEGVCGQDNLGSTDFQKLTFGKNLGVKKDDAGDCDYTISGLDQKIVGTEGVCGQDNLGSTDFQKLTFGKNLGVKKDDAGDCDYTISGLDQKIVGTEGVCGQDNLGSTDFQKLTFGKNLGVKKDDAGDCDYTISGLDQRIAATGQVCGNVDLPAADFQKLTFGRNLDVKLDGGTTCDYSIGGLDQQIQGTYIELNSQCAPDVVVPVGDFKKLIFADNNMVTDNGNCVYTISGLDQKVSSSEGFCPPQGAVASKTFTELNFSDNLSVDMEGTTCTAIIKGLSQQVMAAAVPCMGTVEIEKPASGVSNFITLDFQENIAVSEAGDCKINIKGLSQLIEGTEAICGLTDVSPEATFRKLTFADNLGVEMDDPTGGKLCEYTIKGLDQKVSSTAGTCNGVAAINPAETFKELYFEDNISVSNTSCVATIKGLDQKIYSTEIDPCIAGSVAYNGVNFTSLNFTDNIGVTVDALDTCKYTIKGLDQKIQANERVH